MLSFLPAQSTCHAPGDELYSVTHNGLEFMVRRLLDEAALLLADGNAAIDAASPRYETIRLLGESDLSQGITAAGEIFLSQTLHMYDVLSALHGVLLGLCLALFSWYMLVAVRRHVARVQGEQAQLAALLSVVPTDMDVQGHVRNVVAQVAAKMGTDDDGSGADGGDD